MPSLTFQDRTRPAPFLCCSGCMLQADSQKMHAMCRVSHFPPALDGNNLRDCRRTTMNLRTIGPGLLVVGLFILLQSTTLRAQEAIGSATSVKPQAEANARTLSGGSTVYS